MFKRKIYDKLVRWKKESNGETAVLIDGARRVGKSTVAEAFGKNEYARHIIVDFAHPKASVIDVIRNDPGNLDRFFKTLEYEYRMKLVERNSLIVFDEVQLCPEARQTRVGTDPSKVQTVWRLAGVRRFGRDWVCQRIGTNWNE